MSGGAPAERRAQLVAQRRALAAACRRRGWRPLAPAEQAGLSAEQRTPAGLEETLRLLEAAAAEALLVAKRGRLCHLLADLTALLASAHGQGWTLVGLACSPDPAGPAGEPLGQLLAGFAPFERRLHSQRIRAALAHTRAQGLRLGRPPSMAPYVIKRIRSERAAGKSLSAIANGLNADRIPTAQGGHRWYPATIRHTLNRTP
jgi:DNA invertase Pin-like site-specific DNA recombinase